MLVFLSRDGKIMFWSDSGLVRFISTFVTIMLMIKNGILKKRETFHLTLELLLFCISDDHAHSVKPFETYGKNFNF